MPKFVQLYRGNDWGHEYLAYEARDRPGYADPKKAICTIEGQEIKVCWPDATISTEKIVHKQFHSQVSDMGHAYDADFKIPGVIVSYRDVPVWIPLDAQGLEVLENAFAVGG